jgi:hypothetical protein
MGRTSADEDGLSSSSETISGVGLRPLDVSDRGDNESGEQADRADRDDKESG